MITILGAVFLGATLAPWLPRRWRPGWLLACVPAAGFAYVLSWLRPSDPAHAITESLRWATAAGIDLDLHDDGLSTLFALLILGVGALVLPFSAGYLSRCKRLGRFNSLLLLFMGSMLGLIWAGNLILIYVFWELTTLSSFLLIGFNTDDDASRTSANQALLVTAAGGFAMLAGFVLLGQMAGSYELSAILSAGETVRGHPAYTACLLLIFGGAFTKSAQLPFHFWLPKAMAAPTPVSAYLHSATMVTAGVYLLARLHPVLGATPLWHNLLEITGAATMLVSAAMAVVCKDLKLILAYTTITVLGMLMLLLGIGTASAIEAALVYLLVHALYKGALFLVAGAIDRATGTRDISQLGGLWRAMPASATAALLAALSMAGMPPLFGFISKELLYGAQLNAPRAALWITGAGVTANVLLVTAAILVSVRPFLGRAGPHLERAHEVKLRMLFGPVLLATLGLLVGLFPWLVDEPLIAPAVTAVRAEITHVDLQLWHGINPVFALSAATIALGVALYFFRRALRRLASALAPVGRIGPARLYDESIEALRRAAKATSAALQHGRIRDYVRAVLLTVTVLMAPTLARGAPWPPPRGAASWIVGVVVFLLVVIVIAVLRQTSRLTAIVALTGVGFGIALLYGIFSGVDLTIVQFAVETVTLVLLVLVLHRLPKFVRRESGIHEVIDGALSLAAGIVVAAAAYRVLGRQATSAAAEFYLENTVSRGHGHNVVNTILVDFRALDTLGEISVLMAAGLGVYVLAGPLRKLRGRS